MVTSSTLANATDIAQWAQRREAQDHLPLLVRRLVRATNTSITRIDFPAREAVQLGEWDGITEATAATVYVPVGATGWELGVTSKVKGKAEKDYTTRTLNPLGLVQAKTSFVFVTARRWGAKGKWVRAKRGEGVWREVSAYDADDLEQWLEDAPAVHIWLSNLLGRRPSGVADLDAKWDSWASTTEPPLTPRFLLAGRDELVERISKWLAGNPAVLTLQAESQDEAVAVFIAAIKHLPDAERDLIEARSIVVEHASAWATLADARAPLVLVASFTDRDTEIAKAVRTGHHVLVPLDVSAGADRALQAPKIGRQAAQEALQMMGVPLEESRNLAALATRSLKAFRRALALAPDLQQPPWARPAEGRLLALAMLAGTWSEANADDISILSELAGRPYEELATLLTRWSLEPDPPFRRVGDVWLPVSREDGWRLLKRLLRRDDLERFSKLATEVLTEVDPKFELPQEQRFAAAIYGKSPRWSRLLREGLADMLAILGAEEDGQDDVAGQLGAQWAASIVRDILARGQEDWKGWATLSLALPLLAEAAPNEMLDAIDKGLQGATSVLGRLFQGTAHDVFATSPHVGILWALETLAWHPTFLSRSALLLAKLAPIDPGGQTGNRPEASLREIFLPWRPSTTASLEQRLRVVDLIR